VGDLIDVGVVGFQEDGGAPHAQLPQHRDRRYSEAGFESLVGGLQKRAKIAAAGTLEADTDTVLFVETYDFDDGRRISFASPNSPVAGSQAREISRPAVAS
jgi:hypothetical protein